MLSPLESPKGPAVSMFRVGIEIKHHQMFFTNLFQKTLNIKEAKGMKEFDQETV